MTPEERAEKSAAGMWADDHATAFLGARLEGVGPGTAILSMEVARHHLNGHAICHGGYIFTLADSAFAYACNSYNRNTVAQENSITFLAPGREGDRLTAEAREVTRQGRTGVYDVTVTAGDGRKVALFRGLCREVAGTIFDES